MKTLGIETSCDETAVALYDSTSGIIAETVYSQIDLHKKYGGVVPELASRDHCEKIIDVFNDGIGGVDLDYQEDSTADADINIVMTQDLDLIEIQGTAEERPFSQEQLTEIVSKASSSIKDIVAIQKRAVEG